MLDFINAIDQFSTRIFQVVFARVEEWMDDDETVFRDSAGQHCTTSLSIERSDVGAAAGKAHPERCTGDDHEGLAPSVITKSALQRCASTAGHSSAARSRQSRSIAL